MKSESAPAWLMEFQARFGGVIRTPLDRATGTLLATPSAYDPVARAEARNGPLASGDERLAVYNRQYWFRLFGVLHAAFPLTSRLVGYWQFNDYAARFLLAHPPRHWDIDRVPNGFDVFFSEALESVDAPTERKALREAARLDAAWRGVFEAPPVTAFRPSPEQAPRLLEGRLVASPAVAVIQEHWPLLELRRRLRDDSSEARAALPPRLVRPNWWALVRRPQGIGQLALDAREGELFCLLRDHSVAEALAQLERACSDEERAALPARARAWLARSVELEFWAGLEID